MSKLDRTILSRRRLVEDHWSVTRSGLQNTFGEMQKVWMPTCLSLRLPCQEHAKTTEELSRILASTRDHLESQLSRVQAEKVTMASQLQVHFQIKTQDDQTLHYARLG